MSQIETIERLIQKGKDVLSTHKANPPDVLGFPTLDPAAFTGWQTQCLNFLESVIPPTNPYVVRFREDIDEGHLEVVEAGIGILQSVKEDFELGIIGSKKNNNEPMSVINNICERFHLVARQLRSRYENRDTLDIQDEYDVQDLFHALLQLYFDDIRPEEVTPSYAGKSSRMDFLLKQERIVIELKKTRKGLGAKELGTQLIEDITRYRIHADCDILICFVYDPEGRIANPRGIENDLKLSEAVLKVEVWIRP